MAMVMTEETFLKWARKVEGRLPTWGWIPAWKKVGRYLKDQHKARLKAHKGPDGRSWKKRYSKPAPKVGDVVPIILDSGRVVTQRLKTRRGVRRAKAFRKRFGPPMKPQKALVRTSGQDKARTILDFLTKRATGRSIRISQHKMEYGYTPGTQWIEKLYHGRGTYLKKPIPARPIVGMNARDVTAVENIVADFVMRRVMKGR